MDVPEKLLSARRQLVIIPEYGLLEDFSWHAGLDSWSIRFSLSCNFQKNDFVPDKTNWYAVISSSYPWGEIKIYPDKINGITHTFYHQNYNAPSEKYPWREGDICVNTSLIKWGRSELTQEPFEPDIKLGWYIQRTVEWLTAAADNDLSNDGDPFEIPQLPESTLIKVGFNEDEETYKEWQKTDLQSGLCKLKTLSTNPSLIFCDHYELEKDNLMQYVWGSYLSDYTEKEYDGIWILLNKLPVNLPWELPDTWGALFNSVQLQGIDLKQILRQQYLKSKKKLIRFIQIGFPVAQTIGDSCSHIHWLSITVQLPQKLTGFMNYITELGVSLNALYANGKKIDWLRTENWSAKQITGRGKLPENITGKNIALVGAGAIGSIFAELLCRLACKNITVIDPDILVMGNFSRHTLTMPVMGKPKAESLAARLNEIFPFIDVKFENTSLQQILKKHPDYFSDFDIVLDATASDQVISIVSKSLSNTDKLFLSLSSGLKGNRLFAFMNSCPDCNIENEFRKMITPWLIKERVENKNLKLPRDGIGCWHPVFPARIDDINMLLNAFIKVFERKMQEEDRLNLIVIEKTTDANGFFTGININEE